MGRGFGRHRRNLGRDERRRALATEREYESAEGQPGRFIATAAYGDGGPWYIPVKEAYPQGGYEVSVANCSDQVDAILTQGLRELLGVS